MLNLNQIETHLRRDCSTTHPKIREIPILVFDLLEGG